MDPIIVVGPDGVENEFPAGTSDEVISSAMAQAYPSPAPGAGPGAAAAPAAAPQEAAPALNDADGDGQIDYENTWEGTTPEQQTAWVAGMNDGSINPNFPAGTDQNPFVVPENISDEQIADLVSRGVTYVDREGRMQRKADDTYGLFLGAARPVNNTLDWLQGGLDQVGMGDAFGQFRDQNMRSTTDEGMAEIEALAQQAGVRPGRAGQFAGAVGATAPLALATRNPWLLGAAEGALSSTADDAMGLARDTAIGAVIGKGGDAVTRGLGSMISPNINPATRRLVDQGVEVSPGQLLGGLAHRAEDAMTGIPIIGDIPNASQRLAQESVATVALQRPLSAIGVEMPRNLNSVHEQVDFTQRAVGDAYDELIPQLDVRLDQAFSTDYRALNQSVRNMQPDQVHQWDQLIRNEVAPRFNAAIGPANGRITGESFKELESILGREVRDFSASASPHDRRYASAVRELQAQMRDMLARTNPQHADRLQGINDAYRQLTVLEDAANMAPAGARGRFTPNQLEMAARRADPTIRRRAAARGDSLFQDLSQDAGEVMTRTVGDTGTATRGAMTAGLGAAFFGQSMNIAINPWAVGALALGAIPYNRTGNRLFTAALTQRPEFAGAVRGVVDASAPFVGLAGATHNSGDRNEPRASAFEANANGEMRARFDAIQRQMDAEAGNNLEGLY